jgi:hypothetical protein
MQIANPIYDVVLEFMLEDQEVAKLFISAIIGVEVSDVECKMRQCMRRYLSDPKNKEAIKPEQPFCTIYRFDFSANVSLPDGSVKTVMIEVQKAMTASDMRSLYRYIGSAYRVVNYGIFLFGYDIGFDGCPVVYLDYTCENHEKQKIGLAKGELKEFIESLYPPTWLVQINQLQQNCQNDMEKLLSIFAQTNRTSNQHILEVDESDFPEIYRPIIHRLHLALENEYIKNEMVIEDDYMKTIPAEELGILPTKTKK